MSAEVGFVLVTHQNPMQIAFLCRRLSTIFPGASIALHHDFGQSVLDRSSLPGQIQVVEDWIPTAWGKFSLVAAYLKALRLLHHHASPKWSVSISGSDYPIKSSEEILADLAASSADAFIDFQDISDGVEALPSASNEIKAFHTEQWLRSARERYIGFDVLPHRLRKHVGLANRTLYVKNSLTTQLFTPFRSTYRPHAGDAWHTINKRAAKALLRQDEVSMRLQRFYKRRAIPDESYYQTVLLNEPDLTITNDNRRYSIWPQGARSPRWLNAADVDDMVNSPAHFARKLPFDTELYSAVDSAVQIRAAQFRSYL